MIPVVALGAFLVMALALGVRRAHAAERRPTGLLPPPSPEHLPEPGTPPAEPDAPAPATTPPGPARPAKPAPAKPRKVPLDVATTVQDMARGKASSGQMRRAAQSADKSGHHETARVMRKTADAHDELAAAGDAAPAEVRHHAHPRARVDADALRRAAAKARAARLPATADLLEEKAEVVEAREPVAPEVPDAPDAPPAPAAPNPEAPSAPSWIEALPPPGDLLTDTIVKVAYGMPVAAAQHREASTAAASKGAGEVAVILSAFGDSVDELAARGNEPEPAGLQEAVRLIGSKPPEAEWRRAVQAIRDYGWPALARLLELTHESPAWSRLLADARARFPRPAEPVAAPVIPGEKPPLPPYPTIKRGDQGAWVERAQRRLLALGYTIGKARGEWPRGKPDRDFGPMLEAAVRAFQGDYLGRAGQRLKVDGDVGSETWWALEHGSRAAGAAVAGAPRRVPPAVPPPPWEDVDARKWARFAQAIASAPAGEVSEADARWIARARLRLADVAEMRRLRRDVQARWSEQLGRDHAGRPASLSGLLAAAFTAGQTGFRSWLKNDADKTRFPNTTIRYLRANGIF